MRTHVNQHVWNIPSSNSVITQNVNCPDSHTRRIHAGK